MANNLHWSLKENEFLSINFKKLPVKVLAKKLYRTVYAIYH